MRPNRVRRVGHTGSAGLGNRHWHVWTLTGERYVLREHAHGRTAEDLEYEKRVVKQAMESGWPVPAPVAPPLRHGDRFISLLTYVPGRSRRSETVRHQRERGALLAKLHPDLHSLGLTLGQRPGWSPLHDLEAMRRQVRWEDGLGSLMAIRPELVLPLRKAMQRAERNLAATRADVLDMTLIHGDFTRWNLRFTAGSLTGVLDFDLTHVDSRAAELAVARAARNPAVVDGYRAESERIGWPLSADEVGAVPALDAAMRIGMVGWELFDQQVTGTMDLALVERQMQLLESRAGRVAPVGM